MKCTFGKLAFAFGAAVAASAAHAATYDLPAGQTDTISESVSYTAMNIAGNLTVSGKKTTVSLPSDEKYNVTVPGGSIAVIDNATLGSGHHYSSSWTFSSDDTGAYGYIALTNGTLGSSVFAIADGGAGKDGYIDFMAMSSGTFKPYSLQNNSSLTGRISVTGTSWFEKGGGWCYGNGYFAKGAFEVVLDDATLSFNVGNQLGAFNEEGVSVRLSGAGNLTCYNYYYSPSVTGGDFPIVFRKGAYLNHTGDLILSGISGPGRFAFSASDVIGPNVQSVRYNSADQHTVTVVLDSDTKQTVRKFDLYRANKADALIGSGTLCIDASEPDPVFKAKIPNDSGVTIEKIGEYDVTAVGPTNYPALVVKEGRFIVQNDCVIQHLTIKEGATLVIDGATATVWTFDEESGTVEYLNGGKLVVGQGAVSGLKEVRDLRCDGYTFTKTGDGWLRLYDPVITGGVHVAGGRLSFTRRGLPDRYFKFTFKELLPWNNQGKGTKLCTKLFFYNNAGTRVNPGQVNCYNNGTLVCGKNPWELVPDEITAPEGTTHSCIVGGENENWQRLFKVFHFGSGYNTPTWTRCAITNAADSGCWQILWYRLHGNFKEDFDGINTYQEYGYGNPKTWTVESSPTGQDGTWQTILDKNERHPGMRTQNDYTMNGDQTKPAYLLSYATPGVRNLADTLAVQVDGGAVLDFTMKTGGQTVDKVVYDPSLGGGTMSNVVIAASGTLELTGSGSIDSKQPLPLVFDNSTGMENFADWTVTHNGTTLPRKLEFKDGKLYFVRKGIVIVFQ